MTIDCKFDIGRTVIVPLDGGYVQGAVEGVGVQANSEAINIRYTVRHESTYEVGEQVVTDERTISITEEAAVSLLQRYGRLRKDGLSDEAARWELRKGE